MISNKDVNRIKNRIKKNQLFDCGNLDEFIGTVDNIISYTGYSGSKFFINKMKDITFTTKLSFYIKDSPELYNVIDEDTTNQVDAEIEILKILQKEITYKNISPCIINIIYVKKCESNESSTIIDYEKCREYKFFNDIKSSIYSIFCSHKQNVDRGISHDKFVFMALEYGAMSLRTFLLEYSNSIESGHIFKSFLFQLIFTFYAITKKFPSFKHNDLHADNILLVKDEKFVYSPSKIEYITYTDGKTDWNVPYYGIIPKIIDFGFSTLKEKNIISNARTNKIFTTRLLNNDILILLYDVYNTITVDYIDDLIFELDPTYFYRTFDIEFTNKKNITYSKLLCNKVWNEYKHKINLREQYAMFSL